MYRFILMLAIVAALVRSTPTQACTCEFAWEEIITATWSGEALDQTQIDGLMCPELRLLRNIPYARHGFAFGDNWVGRQFSGDSRYESNEKIDSITVEPMLTPADKTNIDMVVTNEKTMECETWWVEHGDEVAGSNVKSEPASESELEPEPTTYAPIEEMFVGDEGVVTIVLGVATPLWLVDQALTAKVVESAWLVPLNCDELQRVEDALYARHGVDFEDDETVAFFATATIGTYTPIKNLTRELAEEHFFTSRDKLTLLRVNRAQIDKECFDC